MKKLFIWIFLTGSTVLSQNVQLHYDFGQDRNYFTSTFEMYKIDSLGATFWFIDMDYNRPGNSSMSLAYLEFARYFDLPYINPLGFTIQYNDGTSIYGSLGQAWLTGLSFPIHMKYIELSTEFLYRKVSGAHAPDFQFTLVWFKSFFKNKIHVTGYMDIWSQDRTIDSKQVAFQLEPQIWYFFRPALAIGGEMEISKNFLPQYNTVKFMPTIGVKWIF